MRNVWKELRKALVFQVEIPDKVEIDDSFIKKPNDMLMSNDDLFVLVEINVDDVVKTEPMPMDGILRYILNRYADQPIRYFNETQRLKIIHLKSGMIKEAKLVLDF